MTCSSALAETYVAGEKGWGGAFSRVGCVREAALGTLGFLGFLGEGRAATPVPGPAPVGRPSAASAAWLRAMFAARRRPYSEVLATTYGR